jgi:hypothetical protein
MSLPRDKRVNGKKQETACFLTPECLLLHEANSLQQMAVAPWPPELSWWRNYLLTASKRAKNEGTLNANVSFEARAPRASTSDPMHQIELGVQITPGTTSVATYFFVIGRPDGNSRRCLRKLHFDRDVTLNSPEPKPMMHMQLGGGIPACLTGYAANAFDHLDPKFEKPRIPCLPKSFALLTHLALLEYHSTDERLSNFVFDPRWTSVVRQSEDAILKPHFEFCHQWMGRADNKSRSLLNYFYSLPRS